MSSRRLVEFHVFVLDLSFFVVAPTNYSTLLLPFPLLPPLPAGQTDLSCQEGKGKGSNNVVRERGERSGKKSCLLLLSAAHKSGLCKLNSPFKLS